MLEIVDDERVVLQRPTRHQFRVIFVDVNIYVEDEIAGLAQ